MYKELLKKFKKMKKSDPFLITVTLVNKQKKGSDTFLLANNFPYGKFTEAKKMIVKLISEEAKRKRSKSK